MFITNKVKDGCKLVSHVSACLLTGLGLGTPSRYLARTISWNACKLLSLFLLLLINFVHYFHYYHCYYCYHLKVKDQPVYPV